VTTGAWKNGPIAIESTTPKSDPVHIRRARNMMFAHSKNLDQAALAPGKVI
jgi:hypothetical protein